MYHQEGVICLKKGWNPVKESLNENISEGWVMNHYAKGAWHYEACAYSFFDKIEYCKFYNFLFIIISFFMSLAAFIKTKKLNLFLNIFLSLLLALNPVSIYQSLSFYIDGQMASVVISLFAVFILLYHSYYSLFIKLLFFFLITVMINLKFTGLVYAVIACSGFVLLYILKKDFKKFKQLSVFFLLTGIFSTFLIGFSPYTKNIRDHSHPFYPLNEKNLLIGAQPANFINANRFKKAFLSYFSEAGHITVPQQSKYKIPFETSDRNAFKHADTRTAGFGSLFSVNIILSFVIIIFLLTRFRNRYNRLLLYSVLIILASSFANPEAWWARYVPQLYIIPVILASEGLNYKNITLKILSISSLIVLTVNILLIVDVYYSHNTKMTELIDQQLIELKGKKITIFFSCFESTRIRLEEHNIRSESVDLPNKLDCKYPLLLRGLYNKVEFCVEE